jgi:predicted chitinase/V8-like Glu-specific endopeptidase
MEVQMPRWTMNLKTQHATGPARISRASLQLARLVFAVAGVLVLTLAQETGISHAGTSLFTVQDIKKISPRADSSLAKALVDAADDLQKADIRDRLRTAHFIAQVMTETNGLSRLDENMRYRFETLLRVFSRTTISELKAREIAGREQDIANWVYGNRLGNRGRHTQDGWNYRGSGYIQLTGRDNFRNRGREISIDLEGNPERARMARDGLLAAIAYWKAVNVNRAADNNDLLRVRLLVNGPKAHGYEQSRYWFRQSWSKVFKGAGASGNEAGEELAEAYAEEDQGLFDSMMKNSGLISDGFESEADADTVRANGFKQLQKELGLTESGVLDEDTRYALLDPIEWRKLDDSQAASNAPSSPIGTDVYDVAEAPASTEDTIESLEPVQGTGTTVNDRTISPSVLDRLDASKAMYAQYERSGDASNDPETFVPHSVIEPDERILITNTEQFPARAIVKIVFQDEFGGNHTCTGAMVSADTLLTAAHCLHSGTVSGSPFKNFLVIPGQNQGDRPFGQCKGIKSFIPRGWTNAESDTESRYHDFGALKLDCKIGQATGSFGLRPLLDSDGGIGTVVQGYSGNKAPPGVQWLSTDKLRVLWELKGFYQNDTFGGTSGAPVFASGNTSVIIGVHTNGLHGSEEPWKSNNAFTRITGERLAQIQMWLKEQ